MYIYIYIHTHTYYCVCVYKFRYVCICGHMLYLCAQPRAHEHMHTATNMTHRVSHMHTYSADIFINKYCTRVMHAQSRGGMHTYSIDGIQTHTAHLSRMGDRGLNVLLADSDFGAKICRGCRGRAICHPCVRIDDSKSDLLHTCAHAGVTVQIGSSICQCLLRMWLYP